MEEILASIRRIIADDDASKTAQRPPEAPLRAEARHLAPLAEEEAPEVFAPPPPPPPAPPPRIQAEPPPPPPRIEFEPPPPPPPPLAPPPAVEEPVSFHQDTVADQSADILDLTESMATTEPAVPQFRTIDGSSDVDFDESPPPPVDMSPPPAFASPPFPPAPPRLHDDETRLISGVTGAAVDSAFNALAQTVLSQNARTLEDLVREMLRPMLKSWLDDNLPGMVERMVRAEIERVARGRPG
jgi:cell pole-organizing protein PopZ